MLGQLRLPRLGKYTKLDKASYGRVLAMIRAAGMASRRRQKIIIPASGVRSLGHFQYRRQI
jgi:hypothetical protein